MIYAAIVAVSLLAGASATLYTEDAVQQKYMWESFKKEHGKSYETMDVESRRFSIFLENVKMADARNALETRRGGNAVHGITKLADLSQAEFESHFLTSDRSMKTTTAPVHPVGAAPSATTGLVDWTGIYTTPVKDQGYCGSCWAFSATEQIESDTMRVKKQNFILSPEQITQCDSAAFGCGGGWTESAYGYVKKAGGIETDADYPYTSYMGVTGTCSSDKSKYVASINGYVTVSGESNMATYVQTTGPLSVCIDANNWNSYTGGIMTVCGQSVDHCVQAVGVDTSGSAPYWKVRNSWGTSWGESGYIQLAYGQNTCDITNDPTYVTF